MLSRSSVLHYWDAQFGPNPVVGGDPVFARDSAGALIDRPRILRSLIRGCPRSEWVTLGAQHGLLKPFRIPSLLLEPARVNRLTFSRDLAQWTNTNVTLTTGKNDARGTTGATLADATSSGGLRARTVTVVGDGTKAVSIILRRGGAALTEIEFFDSSAATVRHRVRATWSADGAPTLTSQAGAGTIFAAVELVDGFWLISFAVNGVVAANTNVMRLYPAGTAATGSVTFDGAQVEDAVYPSSLLDTTAATAARAVDQFYWRNPFAAQAVAIFTEILIGNLLETSSRIWHIGHANGSAPYIHLGFDSGAVVTSAHNGTQLQAASRAVFAVQGDRLRIVSVIHTDGAPRTIVQKNQDAAAQTIGSAPSGGLITGYSDQRWWCNSVSTNNVGRSLFRRAHAVKLADLTNAPGASNQDLVVTEMDNFLLNTVGEVI
ncbi:MAG: phage head spike fiber domain-containing protein [Longimicrobiales bacterium]